MKSTEVLLLSIVGTGLACYLFSILRGLGNDTALPFFNPNDLFADFFKLVASYPGRQDVHLESWLPRGLATIIGKYLDHNQYSNNPNLSATTLTNFHLTPVAQIINISTRYLFDYLGPGVCIVMHFMALFSLLIYLISLASRTDFFSIRTILISFACIITYPSVFTFLRGYSIAYLGSLLICSSFLLAIKPKISFWIPVLILSLAIGIRPNYILFYPLMLVIGFRAKPGHSKMRKVFTASVVALFSFISTFLLATILYRQYSIQAFINAYGFYSNAYEYGGADNPWSSSLLQPLLIIKTALGRISGMQLIFPSHLKIICLLLALVVCLWGCLMLHKGKISIAKSILICSLGIILGTPVFADYHLLILLSPIMVAMYYEHDLTRSELDAIKPVSLHEADFFETRKTLAYSSMLSNLDGSIIIFLVVPKVFPLFEQLGSLQTFLNPLAICIYLAYSFLHFNFRSYSEDQWCA